MRVCLIIDDYLPESIKAGAKMMHELGVELVQQGHQVTVVTPDADLQERSQISELEGVTVCRFKSGKIKNVSKVRRAINETLLSMRAWKALGDHLGAYKHDLIVYYSPTIFWGRLVQKLRKIWNSPSYLILRDIFPQWAIDSGILSEHALATKFFRHFERVNYAAADTIALQSPGELRNFKNLAISDKPLALLYNWAANDTSQIQSKSFRTDLNLENKIVFFYGGNIGHAQDMLNLVRLAKQMQPEEDAHFLFVGKGDEFDLVQLEIAREGLTNLTLLPPVTQADYQAMLMEFDVGLFSLHPAHTTNNFPGKLLGYMLAQIPILGSINQHNDLKSVVEDAGAGLITVNGDDRGFLENAHKLYNDEALRSEIGANARRLLKSTFSVKSAAEQIINRHTKSTDSRSSHIRSD